MRRIVLTAVVWLVFVGGLAFYMEQRDAAVPDAAKAIRLKPAEGTYTLEVTPTFSAESDPFALQTSDAPKAAALVVRLGERELLRLDDVSEADKPIVIEDVQGLVRGSNELYLEASPPTDRTDRRYFVQLRVLKDGVALAEETFWSQDGAQVAGSFRFDIESMEEDDHDH